MWICWLLSFGFFWQCTECRGKFVFLLSAYTGMLSQGPPGNPASWIRSQALRINRTVSGVFWNHAQLCYWSPALLHSWRQCQDKVDNVILTIAVSDSQIKSIDLLDNRYRTPFFFDSWIWATSHNQLWNGAHILQPFGYCAQLTQTNLYVAHYTYTLLDFELGVKGPLGYQIQLVL